MKNLDSLREQCLIMAQNNHTSAGFWLGCSLSELRRWIDANNRIIERVEKNRSKK
ncbi:MAG: hypothetical protein OSJ64_08180 [Firmicutes bacterium]|nr:hypothetical protein [Bacillota bacterium]